MARGKKKTDDATPPGEGHNVVIDEEGRAALNQYYTLKLRQSIAEAAKAEAKEAQEEVNSWFSKARGDLGYTRKEMEEQIALQNMTEAQFLAHEARRRQRMVESGLPVMNDLFDKKIETITDTEEAEANGYRAGRRADEPKVPDEIDGSLHSMWMQGWHRGQGDNAKQLEKADAIITSRATPNAGAETLPLNEE